jgi:peroxiredoxin Q/BCP
MPLKPGDPAPDFRLASHEGKTLALADYRGLKLLIWFYPEADTPG